MAVVDWVIVAAYLAFSLGVGIFFARRAGRSTREFFISGRSLPWWLAGTSMVATSFASDTPLVVTGWVRSDGISFNWIWWSFAIGGMFSVFLLSRLWRRAEVITDVELTELRYSGKSAAALRAFRGAYMGVIVNCITLAWVIVAMVKLAGTLAPLPPAWVRGIGSVLEPVGLGWVDPQKFLAVAVCIVLTATYSVLSGLWGVVVTDLLQFILAMGGAILLCVLAVSKVGGLAELARGAAESSALGERLLEFFPRLPEKGHWFGSQFWSGPFFGFCVFLSMQWWANKNADGGGVVVQRMLSARDERHALLGTLWFNIANYALRPWPWILVALASVIVFPEMDGESAYPAMMKRFVPAGLMGVMVASFLGAFMSTIDTHLNLSSAYIVNDVYRRFVCKHAPESHYVLVSRIASVCFVILGSAIALISDSISGLFVFLLAFTSGFGLVLVLRWFWWRINAWSELSAMIASGVISSLLYVLKSYVLPQRLESLSRQGILAITVVGSTGVWLAVTLLTSPVSTDKLVAFYRRVRPYGAWGRIAAESGIRPPSGLGWMILNWLAGSVMVLAATLGIGKLLLGFGLEGVLYLAAAATGAVLVWLGLRRADGLRSEGPSPGGSRAGTAV